MAFRIDLRPLHFLAIGLLGLAPLACGTGDGDAPDGPGDTDSDADSDAGTGGTGPDGGSGGGTATGGGGGTNNPGDYMFPDGRGPLVPFSVYEAEDMQLSGGELLGPSRNFGEVAAESSGRRAVRLDAAGEYVSFTNQHASNALVIRYSIPDGNDSGKKLSVLVNDVEVAKLDVTSRYAWSYRGDNNFNQPSQNDPGAGTAHHFYDDVRAIVGDIPVGATVKIQHPGGGEGAAYYVIDLVEVEQAPAPLPQPGGYKSIVECGATPNDGTDDTAAFQTCIDGGGNLYIPEGEFNINSTPPGLPQGAVSLQIANRKIRGAGIWHSTLRGTKAAFACWGGGCEFYDFSVFGETTARSDTAPIDDIAFGGGDFTNSVIENVWVEHRRVALWTHGKNEGSGNNLIVRNCRFRNLHADGLNFYGGLTNSVVENCHIRNTGDDGIAAWSDGARPVNSGNIFRHNFVSAPWMANGIAIYGGNSTTLEDNVVAEGTQYTGIFVSTGFGSHAFGGTNNFTRNTVLRAGGIYHDDARAAFDLEASQSNLANITVTDLDIVEPSHFGIRAACWGGRNIGSVYFTDVTITNPIDAGMFFPADAWGSMDATGIVITVQAPANAVVDDAGNGFEVIRHDGNVGW